MQARTVWSPPAGVLGRLCEEASARALVLRPRVAALRQAAAAAGSVPSFIEALGRGESVHVVAEIKRRSPSMGALDEQLDGVSRAQLYVQGGASAISVLTETRAFGGSYEDLAALRRAVTVPLLKKDFHVDPAQVWEARALGASALLLIVRALGPEGTSRMADAAREAEIEALFEVRDLAELDWALEAGAQGIGVNRRDLETLELDDDVPALLLPRVPASCVAIAESGIGARVDVETVARLGADAVLVGSSLTRAANSVATVRALGGVQRRRRSG